MHDGETSLTMLTKICAILYDGCLRCAVLEVTTGFTPVKARWGHLVVLSPTQERKNAVAE